MDETAQLLNNALRDGKNILFEGAQGTLLDIDHGTYPYVRHFELAAGGAATGTGVGPTAINRVLGIQKAYVTRVGGGPFPTELLFAEDGGQGQDAVDGETLCSVGHEFGVTTGRKRRCGWFDAVIARYAAEVNGLTDVALTKLDVLSAFDTIKVCVAYECEGKRYDYFPMQQSVLFHAKPIYEELPGWKGVDITECKTYEGASGEHAQIRGVSRRRSRACPCRSSASAPIAIRRSCVVGKVGPVRADLWRGPRVSSGCRRRYSLRAHRAIRFLSIGER